MELYLYSPMRFHGVVLKYRTTFLYLYLLSFSITELMRYHGKTHSPREFSKV